MCLLLAPLSCWRRWEPWCLSGLSPCTPPPCIVTESGRPDCLDCLGGLVFGRIRDRGVGNRAELVRVAATPVEVYYWCMSRTNIDLDDEACRAVMERYRLASKREAVNLALRRLAAEPLDLADARRLRGSGWDGDLDEMRASRAG